MVSVDNFIAETERLNPNILGDPEIKRFDGYKYRGQFFAVYDFMGVKPTLSSCNGFLQFCDDCRGNKLKLPAQMLSDELRAFTTIKNSEYVTYKYEWQE